MTQAKLSFAVADTLTNDIPMFLQFLDGCANTIHAIPADMGEALCGIVPILRQRKHEGEKPFCF